MNARALWPETMCKENTYEASTDEAGGVVDADEMCIRDRASPFPRLSAMDVACAGEFSAVVEKPGGSTISITKKERENKKIVGFWRKMSNRVEYRRRGNYANTQEKFTKTYVNFT